MIFMYLLAPFNVQNFKKSLEWIRSVEDAVQLRVQKGPFTPTRYFFLGKTIKFHVPLGPFYCPKLKKKRRSRVIKSHQFRAQNDTFV